MEPFVFFFLFRCGKNWYSRCNTQRRLLSVAAIFITPDGSSAAWTDNAHVFWNYTSFSDSKIRGANIALTGFVAMAWKHGIGCYECPTRHSIVIHNGKLIPLISVTSFVSLTSTCITVMRRCLITLGVQVHGSLPLLSTLNFTKLILWCIWQRMIDIDWDKTG